MLSFKSVLLLTFTAVSYFVLAIYIDRTQFEILSFCIFISFLSYYFLSKQELHYNQIIYIGLGFRLIFFFTTPVLSDDYFRFIWDGKMILEGISPFQYLPSEFIKTTTDSYYHYLFEGMNSKGYFSVYPPISQLVYTVSALLDNTLFSFIIIRLFLIGGDILALVYLRKLLNHFKKDESLSLLYFLNPLIILEFTGNLHFEGLMIGLLLISVYYFVNLKYWQSALLLSLSVGVKLLPLMFVPLLFFRVKGKEKWIFASLVGIFTIFQFVPFVNIALLQKMMTSVNLYFQSFEFNASVYYLLRWIGYQIYGYNVIQTLGVSLAIISLFSILFISFIRKIKPIFITLLLLNTLYLLLSTTVHPWYLAMPLIFSVFTNYKYMILWSLLVYLSYSAYQTDVYNENLYLVGIEYFIVFGVIVYEFWNNKKEFS